MLELIVTIAVMVVLVATVIASSSVLDGSYVKDAERGVEDYITIARSKSMSVAARDWYMTISKDGSAYVVRLNKVVEIVNEEDDTVTYNTVLVDEQELGNKVTVTFGKDAAMQTISAENELDISFDPATGKVDKVRLNGTDVDISAGIGYIGIKRGTYDITLKVYYNTGKCERE